MSISTLARELREALAAVAEPGRAEAMKAYMKSTMPFLGVAAPAQYRVHQQVFGGMDFPTAAAWRRTALGLWRGARYREERHAAIGLTRMKRFDAFQDLLALRMYEEMIVTGAWWDYVDVLAIDRLGLLLRRFPREMRREMLAWSRSDDLWKRRSAILCQIGFKRDTDLALLYATIEPALSSREFFLRKAIGWALRQHAWTDPAEVRRYVREHEEELSGLSKREALKNITPRRRASKAGAGAARSRRA